MRQPVAHILLMGVLGAVILLGVTTGSVTANETEEIDGLSEYSEEEIKEINKLVKNISGQQGFRTQQISPAWTPIGSTGCKVVSEENISVKYCPPEFGELTQIEEAVEPSAQTVRVPYNGAELTINQGNESNTLNSEEHSSFRWDKSGFLSYQDYGDDWNEVNIDHDDRHGGQYDYQLTARIPPRDIGEHTKYQMTVSGIVEWDFLIGWNTIEELPEREFQGEPYYTFEDVHDVAVIYADFEGDEQAENKHGQLENYQSRMTSKINKYMAHSIGAMGLEGYDFTHYDNGGRWYDVSGTPDLIANDSDEFWETFSRFGRGAIRGSKSFEYFEDNYDTTIVVSAGDQTKEDHFNSDRAIYNISDDFVYVNEFAHRPSQFEGANPLGEGGNLSVMPTTLNKASSGRWVTAKLEIPFDDIDLDSVDVSSFKLNSEVDAVADERYGFVRNPVSGNELLLKFPRAEVIDLLETGDDVDVTVSGTLESGEILIGDDEIRVINEGNRSLGTRCATRRDRVSQNAIVHAMFPCPPGLQNRPQTPGEGAPPGSHDSPRGPQEDRLPGPDRPSTDDHERSPAGDDETPTRAGNRGRGPPEDGPPAGKGESRGPPERADQAKERSDEARGPPPNPGRGPNPRLTPSLSGLGQINTVP